MKYRFEAKLKSEEYIPIDRPRKETSFIFELSDVYSFNSFDELRISEIGSHDREFCVGTFRKFPLENKNIKILNNKINMLEKQLRYFKGLSELT